MEKDEIRLCLVRVKKIGETRVMNIDSATPFFINENYVKKGDIIRIDREGEELEGKVIETFYTNVIVIEPWEYDPKIRANTYERTFPNIEMILGDDYLII